MGNKSSRDFKRWDKQGTVIEVGKNDQYLIRVTGTGRMTLRNRRFLRKFRERPLFVNRSSDQSVIRHPETVSTVTPPSLTNPDIDNDLVERDIIDVENSGSDHDAVNADNDSMFGDSDEEDFFGFPGGETAEQSAERSSEKTINTDSDNSDMPSGMQLRRSTRRKVKPKRYNASKGVYE